MSHVYQPLLPAASRYLQERWDQAAYRQHRSKVDSASPVVDTWGPQPPLHLPVNLKRMQLDRARRAVRERDDCIHSARLLAIAQSRGRVDNWNSYCAHSLSSERRRQELVQIAAENQRLTGRLGRWQVACAQAPWERRWERMEITRDSSARYPCGGQAPQTGAKKQRQEALSHRLPSSGPEERRGGSQRGVNSAPPRRARGAATPHQGAPGEMGPSPPQRLARREGTVPASGACLGTGASARRPSTAASSSPRGLATSAGAVAGEHAGGLLATAPRASRETSGCSRGTRWLHVALEVQAGGPGTLVRGNGAQPGSPSRAGAEKPRPPYKGGWAEPVKGSCTSPRLCSRKS